MNPIRNDRVVKTKALLQNQGWISIHQIGQFLTINWVHESERLKKSLLGQIQKAFKRKFAWIFYK